MKKCKKKQKKTLRKWKYTKKSDPDELEQRQFNNDAQN